MTHGAPLQQTVNIGLKLYAIGEDLGQAEDCHAHKDSFQADGGHGNLYVIGVHDRCSEKGDHVKFRDLFRDRDQLSQPMGEELHQGDSNGIAPHLPQQLHVGRLERGWGR